MCCPLILLFSLVFRLFPCFHNVEEASFIPYINFSEGIEQCLFDNQIHFSNNDLFHINNGKLLMYSGAPEIIGDKRAIILEWNDSISYVRDDAKVFYMGSRRMSRKTSYHFIYIYLEDTIQYVMMLCEYNGMIRSIIEVEHTIVIPFGEKNECLFRKLINGLCIIEDTYNADEILKDDTWATVTTRYSLFIRKGVVTKCLYRQREIIHKI